ncbi:hypothetical protein NSK_003382 [Nannochloropsis salina CCMP1776]|uniref:Uncharacterized protein n=1 Tax=Nannochloropsis salina CCMP1776 TaxID=1027361 RepID=A0A4D9D2X6_9STRA|nr:hypothetical protein NSK_003382 [Nannochloropsis salina CCMP1776]|eukprot:TFJ85334.1 hypothetical protein NSK_003382 [Nannochloropsis salina CCMP1776]
MVVILKKLQRQMAKSRSGNASSTIAPSPSIPAPHTPSVPPSRAASTSLGALGAATTAGVVPKAGRGTKKAVTSDVAGPRLASLGSEPSKRKRHRSSATGRVGGSTAAASEAPDRVLSGGVAGMEAIFAGLGGAAEPSSASASLLYMLRNAKPMVQQQVMSTLSDPHFPALVTEMEEMLAPHMKLFLSPLSEDDEEDTS